MHTICTHASKVIVATAEFLCSKTVQCSIVAKHWLYDFDSTKPHTAAEPELTAAQKEIVALKKALREAQVTPAAGPSGAGPSGAKPSGAGPSGQPSAQRPDLQQLLEMFLQTSKDNEEQAKARAEPEDGNSQWGEMPPRKAASCPRQTVSGHPRDQQPQAPEPPAATEVLTARQKAANTRKRNQEAKRNVEIEAEIERHRQAALDFEETELLDDNGHERSGSDDDAAPRRKRNIN